ncbi:biotin transport system substrate-specific component [Enterococcus sp. PF1-24]|uniref:biotin transporter BioY n=1 Tax=unclassified Enterococcus TaxID=2608891 RepID=UPI0024748B52|nr:MULTISPECIES: biotin transporter BioY [unclassified Enterococcus]MDH6363789.1 biotin transport system substrate-specific component [Enterococcus sp. PFB1-1]MDH6400745.1 biotin transport system substrate-specific component [Enterococcus sp. PF1-24]
MKLTSKQMVLIAEFAAIIAVLSQITIPLALIPLTLQTFAVGFVATISDKKSSTYAVLIYLLLGLIGLPVFANFRSGMAVLFGPTGGFLIGFIFNAFITSWLMSKKTVSYGWAILANISGAFFTLLFGTIWLQFGNGMTFADALAAGFIPFIIPGIIKAVAAACLGVVVLKRVPFLKQNNKK